MKDILDFLLKREQTSSEANISINGESIPINPDVYQAIPETSEQTITFIDGGNGCIMKTSALALHLIRVVGVTYAGEKRKQIQKKEFFCLVYIEEKAIRLKTFPTTAYENLSLHSVDEAIDVVRRLAELDLAQEIATQEHTLHAVVLDGILSSPLPVLQSKVDQLLSTISGLGKTSTIITSKGTTALAQLGKKQGIFLYGPIGNSALYATRLHAMSRYVFLAEGKQIPWSSLRRHAQDPAFIGYPFGLVLADKLARVSQQEQQQYYQKLLFIAGAERKQLLQLLSSQDAHETLDSLGN